MLHLLFFLGILESLKIIFIFKPRKKMPFFEDEVVPFSGEEVVVFYMLQLILPETNSNKHLKIGPNCPNSLPTIHFQVRTVSFREGTRWAATSYK